MKPLNVHVTQCYLIRESIFILSRMLCAQWTSSVLLGETYVDPDVPAFIYQETGHAFIRDKLECFTLQDLVYFI